MSSVQVAFCSALIIAAFALVAVVIVFMGLVFLYFFQNFQLFCVYDYGLGFTLRV